MGISYSQGTRYLIDFDQMAGDLEKCPNQFYDYKYQDVRLQAVIGEIKEKIILCVQVNKIFCMKI
jgi:hypothetical protein